jgi:hypothetical protein
MKAGSDLAKTAKSAKENDLAKPARSFNPESGKRGGSTKDPFKKKVVEEAKKHGISKRTAEKAIAKDRGPTQPPRKESKPATAGVQRKIAEPPASKPEPSNGTGKVDHNAEDVIRKVLAFIDKSLSHKSFEILMTVADRIHLALLKEAQGLIFKGTRQTTVRKVL